MSLLSLPFELLIAVISHLSANQYDFDNVDHYYKPDVTLYRLAQTCTTLGDLCIPKLYEIINLQTYVYFSRQRKLLRTLAAKPNLARLVKRVIVDGSFSNDAKWHRYSDDGPVISVADAKTFNEIMEKKVDMTTVTPFREMQQADLTERHDCKSLGRSLSCLSLALVPNIRSVIFILHYGSLGSFKTDSFPLLKDFSLQHADTEFGVAFEAANGVLHAAPGVNRFIGRAVDRFADNISYPSIKKLVLVYSCIDDEDMALLPTLVPNLESFSHSYGGSMVSYESPASPRTISTALLALKKTLKHVELDIYYRGDEMWINIDADDGIMESLSQMQTLQSLIILASYVYPGKEFDASLTSRKLTLVNFLPRSIETLHIEELKSDHLQDVLDLAAAAPAKFSKLSHVRLPEFDTSLHDDVCRAFHQLGIACSFETVEMDEYTTADCA
ncbi:hypothetical protein VHEMI09357 [[Torrubiella] hemipterigena]|uniref:Leucine-rich repeat domain-containing protein n=1 Tax=[Torrubiella] hemipterigena TaxID=1531966 RepID=A0A0A1TQ73_9HYPO|nr:hypothetical protein VHEMI09357 [[Torrubiella] hemipterigena]